MDNIRFDRWFTKAVNPDFTTRGGFRWAFPGEWTTDPADRHDTGMLPYSDLVCPQEPGDGLSVAKTVYGMAQGGYVPRTVLIVGCDEGDVSEGREQRQSVLTILDFRGIIPERK